MEIEIRTSKGILLEQLMVHPHMTILDIKTLFAKACPHLYPERVLFRIYLSDHTHAFHTLNNYDTVAQLGLGSGDVLYLKDLGMQISKRLSGMIKLLGPILIFTLFYGCPNLLYSGEGAPQVWSKIQIYGYWMMILHFVKQELEVLLLHRFHTMAIPRSDFLMECANYWILCGILIGYFLFHPEYSQPTHSQLAFYMAFVIFLFAELMNFSCHIILRNIRNRDGSSLHKVPYGLMFGYVSCANYFWELLAWGAFAYFVWCFTDLYSYVAWIFLIVMFIRFNNKAFTIHYEYLKEFQEEYPKYKKALIPFLL